MSKEVGVESDVSGPILQVAIPAPLDGLFDYLAPIDGEPRQLVPGVRVRVQFGRREHCGVLIDTAESSSVPHERLRPVTAVLDVLPVLDSDHLDFLRWAATYYHHPVGEVIAAALPSRLRSGRPVSEVEPATAGKTDPLQTDTGSEPELNAEQQHAFETVAAGLDRFGVHLLRGITGSGKTEVYLRLAAVVLAQGRSVLLLVPEIALAPQLLARLQERFGSSITLLHSGLAAGKREQQWQRARHGISRLVIGTRSAVLAPIPDLGLVVVDEEQDPSYKQQDGFRYSARDLAVVRAQRAGCPVVLGSATPSLESLFNVGAGRYQQLRLTRRAGGAEPPRLRLLDVRSQRLEAGMSEVLLREAASTLERGEQVLVFLNRRGFAPVITCGACGWLSDCPHCDARQTLHAKRGVLWCHHCGAQRPLPPACPDCGAVQLRPLGQGTERVEQYLAERFPAVPLLRIDRDATRRKGSLDQMLAQAGSGAPVILIGTQMLAKGHHLPRVTLVGVLNADSGLFSADFRAPERTAQLITQVAGRAGRGDAPGQVLIQTEFPEHPLLQLLSSSGYDDFATAALAEREGADLPPYSYQALLRAEAGKAEAPGGFLAEVLEIAQPLAPGVMAWGPAPAPMERRAGRYRAHLLLQASERALLQTQLRRLMPQLRDRMKSRRVRWSLDVDPVDLF